MPSRIKAIFQYTALLLITAFLVWFSLRSISVKEGENKWDYILSAWKLADKGWLMLMLAISMVSHFIRAVRWRMLLVPTGNNVTISHSFLSLMVGYLVNLVIPRGGEVSRCYNLYKLGRVPADVSFGTVVVERVVDLLCLLSLLVLAFALETQKLFAFIETLPIDWAGATSRARILIYLAAVGVVCVVILFVLIRRSKKIKEALGRVWQGVKTGLSSIARLEKKGLFILYSILIWFMYFLMSYCVIKAFPATAHMGYGAVFSLFGIGAIAMAAPLPGGTGSYHLLVPQGLSFLYAVSLNDATALTFIFHGWQTFIMIVSGAISIIITSIIVRKNSL